MAGTDVQDGSPEGIKGVPAKRRPHWVTWSVGLVISLVPALVDAGLTWLKEDESFWKLLPIDELLTVAFTLNSVALVTLYYSSRYKSSDPYTVRMFRRLLNRFEDIFFLGALGFILLTLLFHVVLDLDPVSHKNIRFNYDVVAGFALFLFYGSVFWAFLCELTSEE